MNCGPKCVQWLEAQRYLDLSLKEARRLCRTTRDGTYCANMMTALRTLGYPEVRLRENLTWLQLTALLPHNWVLITWWTHLEGGALVEPYLWDGHWSVATEVTKKSISMYDPDCDDTITVPRVLFEPHWADYEDCDGDRRDFVRSAVVARR